MYVFSNYTNQLINTVVSFSLLRRCLQSHKSITVHLFWFLFSLFWFLFCLFLYVILKQLIGRCLGLKQQWNNMQKGIHRTRIIPHSWNRICKLSMTHIAHHLLLTNFSAHLFVLLSNKTLFHRHLLLIFNPYDPIQPLIIQSCLIPWCTIPHRHQILNHQHPSLCCTSHILNNQHPSLCCTSHILNHLHPSLC